MKKLLFLGSTCIYPKEAPQPMKEDCLLTSPLEYTNEEYTHISDDRAWNVLHVTGCFVFLGRIVQL